MLLLLSPRELTYQSHKNLDSYGYRFYSEKPATIDQLLMSIHLFRYRLQYRDTRFLWHAILKRKFSGDLNRRLGENGFFPAQGEFVQFQKTEFLRKIKGFSELPSLEKISEIAKNDLRDFSQFLKDHNLDLIIIIAPEPNGSLSYNQEFKKWISKVALLGPKKLIF